MKRFILPFMLLLPALAQGQASDPSKFVLQQLSTTLPDELINLKGCLPDQMKLLSSTRFPKANGTIVDGSQAPLPFLMGICYAHQAKQDLETIYHSIENLQAAATRGLMVSQKSAAALFEGIEHCRAAAIYDKTRNQILRDKDLFCQHRAMAREAFSEINWFQLNLKYENPARDASKLSEQMGTCGNEILSSDLDADCSVITPLDKDSVDALAEKAVAEVMPNFVDVSVPAGTKKPSLPPFTAMLSRKLTLTTDALAGMGDELAKIKASSEQLHKDVTGLVDLYGNYNDQTDSLEIGPGTIPDKIAKLKDRYLLAVSKARALLELAQRWEDGLTTGGDLSNKATALLAQITELNNQLKFIKENEGSKDSLFGAVEILRDEIAKSQGGDVQRQKKVVRSLCALYYCDMRSLNSANLQRICKTKIEGTNTPYSEVNSLCDPTANGVLKGSNGTTRKVSDVCQANGFDTKYIKPTNTEESAEACLQSQFDSVFWERNTSVAKGS